MMGYFLILNTFEKLNNSAIMNTSANTQYLKLSSIYVQTFS